MIRFFRIKSVDHDGYNGRDFPPEDSDIGLIVRPIHMDVTLDGDDGSSRFVWGNRASKILSDALPYLLQSEDKEDAPAWIVTCYTCITMDGRILELMDFEVEPA